MGYKGKVGPFFYLSGEIISDSVPSFQAQRFGDFKTFGDHSKFWDKLAKKLRVLEEQEYFCCPRGRVTYNYKKDIYYIYLNSSLNNETILKKIIKEFQLEGLNYVVDDTDEHYQIIEDCCYEHYFGDDYHEIHLRKEL